MKNIASMWWDVHNCYEISANGVDGTYDVVSALGNSRMGTIGFIEHSYDGRIFRVADLGTIGPTVNGSICGPIGYVG